MAVTRALYDSFHGSIRMLCYELPYHNIYDKIHTQTARAKRPRPLFQQVISRYMGHFNGCRAYQNLPNKFVPKAGRGKNWGYLDFLYIFYSCLLSLHGIEIEILLCFIFEHFFKYFH